MCGIVGVISKDMRKKHKDFFQQALLVDTLRGTHSTGIARIPNSAGVDVEIFKRALAAWDFLDLRRPDELLGKFYTTSAFIGHNRYATKGAINNRNSHPFQAEHITLVHNGSLLSTHNLPDNQKFVVDSENIAHAIAQIGFEETAKLLNGAFALAWHDATDNTLHLARNKERPMWFVDVKNEDTILYGSEDMMLDWLAGRNGIETETVYEVLPGQHITFHLGDKKRKLMDYDCREVELYKPPVQRFPVPSYPGYNNRQAAANDAARKLQAKALEREGLKVGDKIPFAGMDYVPYGAGSQFGKIIGCMEDEPWLPIEIHRCQAADFTEGATYNGRIASIRISGEPKTPPTLVLDGIARIVDVKEEDVETAEETEGKKHMAYIPGPGGRLINFKDWSRYTQHGCSMCQGDLDLKTVDFIEWIDDSPMCADCAAELRADDPMAERMKRVH